MKLFLRDHVILIVTQIVQFISIAGIFWLAGFRNTELILYCMFLGCFFLVCYLAYYYLHHRKFYKRLTEPIGTLDESLQKLDQAVISEKLGDLLTSQYNEYQKQIAELNNNQEEHLIFMDRWVHQMKTPLSVIELMAKDLDEPESSSFREETARLKTGLNMVLYMARLRTIEQDFHIKKVSLLKLVQEVNQENKRLFIQNHIYPEVKANQEKILVETDEKWLFFVVSQFIQNAVKYSVNQANKIQISLDKNDDRVTLEVKDFGVGIPKEDQKRIFDAFYTGKNGRKFNKESTGVGLFLVHEVIHYLGHQLEVDSSVDRGSSFRVIF